MQRTVQLRPHLLSLLLGVRRRLSRVDGLVPAEIFQDRATIGVETATEPERLAAGQDVDLAIF